ncbi:adenosine deaminase [Thiotrichales bacterium 19S3-7]|nr:adenosine deaminase [Thiotrichales bacterium 19S3-7]MCF6802718.1 adenosine deaminase [Thiotrichales bacterium 19S3-11]
MINNINSLLSKAKAELHVHLEGTLEAEMMLSLAQKNNVKLKYKNLTELKKAYNFNNLQEFLDLYYQGMSVLINESDYYELTYAYLKKAKQDNVSYAEIFVDPQAHVSRGISLETMFRGISNAIKDAQLKLGINATIILCFLRHLSESDALHLFDKLMDYRNYFIGIGLDSSELGHPPKKFKQLFNLARDEKLHLVAHAGEEGPPEYVWQALDILGVERIDHGNAILYDQTLIERVANEQIPLTMCPLSNKALKVETNLRNHPAKTLLNKGVKVTINSDDPAYFSGYINQNYEQLISAVKLSQNEIERLIDNSLSARFI